jgi:hypothetical protein
MTAPRATVASVIENWMLSSLKNHGYDRYEDLHIDRINQAWKPRDSWFEGGLEAFRLAVDIRNQHAPGFSIVLTLALAAGNTPRGANFQTLEEIKAQLAASPPSLYLFQKGKEPWTKTGLRDSGVVADEIVVENMSHNNALKRLAQTISCYYMEFRQIEFNEYSRAIFVTG